MMRLESLPGSLLDQKYKVERPLGKGAMGAVFKAVHLGTMRTVAVKVIEPDLAAAAEFSHRFKREAEAAGRLRHPNVVNVTDFGITQVEGSDVAYLVMEYLDGQTLSGYLRNEPRPSFNFILDTVDQAALALDAAHAAGIVHRDLKPSNIWLEPNHRDGYNLKVLDFGIAKVSGRAAEAARPTGPGDDEALPTMRATVAMTMIERVETPIPNLMATPSHLQTTVGTLLGTPAYMAPEQCQGLVVDHRADIYSLATITYEMLCSRLPFQAANFDQQVQMQVNEMPQAPHQRDASVPVPLSDAVISGLAKNPADRPPSAGAFAARLRSAAEGEAASIRKSRDVVHTHGKCFLPLLVACMVPVLGLLLTAWALAHVLDEAKVVPAWALASALGLTLFGLSLFAFQMYKAACFLVLCRASENNQFQPMLRTVAASLFRGMPALLITQLLCLLQWRPSSFRDSLLWPVVWAAEGRSGKDALSRSRQLCRGLGGTAVLGFAARQYGPPAFGILMVPAIISLVGGWPGLNSLLQGVLSGTPIGLFYLVESPGPMVPLLFYGPAYAFLYWSCLASRGEAADSALPSATRDEKRSGSGIRPSTLVWTGLPLLCLSAVLWRGTLTDISAALETAADDGRRAAVLQALNAGLPADHEIHDGETPLFEAVRTGDVRLVEALLGRGANVNAHSRSGTSPLIVASIQNRDNLVRLLLDRGAAVDAPDNDGRTALIEAAMRGNLPIVQMLLDRGADRKRSDAYGKTALSYAREEGNQALAAALAR